MALWWRYDGRYEIKSPATYFICCCSVWVCVKQVLFNILPLANKIIHSPFLINSHTIIQLQHFLCWSDTVGWTHMNRKHPQTIHKQQQTKKTFGLTGVYLLCMSIVLRTHLSCISAVSLDIIYLYPCLIRTRERLFSLKCGVIMLLSRALQ